MGEKREVNIAITVERRKVNVTIIKLGTEKDERHHHGSWGEEGGDCHHHEGVEGGERHYHGKRREVYVIIMKERREVNVTIMGESWEVYVIIMKERREVNVTIMGESR